jgi:hypothetical protein
MDTANEASMNRLARTELSLSLLHACCHKAKHPVPFRSIHPKLLFSQSLCVLASWREILYDWRPGVIRCTLQLPHSAFYTAQFYHCDRSNRLGERSSH